MSYDPLPVQTSGGQERVWTADDETRELLKMILSELRIMNMYFASMTDIEVTVNDVEIE